MQDVVMQLSYKKIHTGGGEEAVLSIVAVVKIAQVVPGKVIFEK